MSPAWNINADNITTIQGLSAALEEKAEMKKLVRTVQTLQLEQAKRELAEAQLLATRRSGARGLKARQALIEKENAVEEAHRRRVIFWCLIHI